MMMKNVDIAPILKWAGGKRWLVKSGKLPVPENYNRYLEPFVGGGAVFFHVCPEEGIIADVNPELVNLYQCVHLYPTEMAELMQGHQILHCKEYYYYMRESLFHGRIERAARFLYLNRSCWNGLYRVNMKGEFNVPIGTKTKVVFESDNYKAMSMILGRVDIKCSDFEEIVSQGREGDFIFVDPPYTVKHNYNGFLKYNERIFSWDDQERLAKSLIDAASRGCAIVVTNADHESVRALYRGKAHYHSVERASVLASSSARRGFVTEAIFTFNM